jgi:undecaprenyl-diphosphatase
VTPFDVAAAALLGVVQGLTEFLPVSSSAHLILARAFFGWDAEIFGLPFDVACHVGTLLAVVVFFQGDFRSMARALPRVLRADPGPDGRRIRLIAIGTLPVVFVGGVFWTDAVSAATRTPLVVASVLALGAGLLLLIERLGPRRLDDHSLTTRGALLVGVAQAVALVPGVSRSGVTIAAGMGLGLRREAAARFGFLMSVPAVTAAAVREAYHLRGTTLSSADLTLFAVGMGTSAIVGYLTIKYFLRFLVSNSLDVFAWYRLALAMATLVWWGTR